MADTAARGILIGALFLLTICLGLGLSHSGRPLNAVLSAIHKLAGLAAAVVTAVVFVNLLKDVDAGAFLIALLAAAGICIAALIATGAILSGAKAGNGALLLVHNICTVLEVLCLAGAIYTALIKTPV